MGWNELVARPEIDKIFRKAKKKYTLKWVSAPYPQVRIQHEGKLGIAKVREILDLFPDLVYVEMLPDVPFAADEEGDVFEYEG